MLAGVGAHLRRSVSIETNDADPEADSEPSGNLGGLNFVSAEFPTPCVKASFFIQLDHTFFEPAKTHRQ